jgi:hypothetical protein
MYIHTYNMECSLEMITTFDSPHDIFILSPDRSIQGVSSFDFGTLLLSAIAFRFVESHSHQFKAASVFRDSGDGRHKRGTKEKRKKDGDGILIFSAFLSDLKETVS